jgi:hypothetical protein
MHVTAAVRCVQKSMINRMLTGNKTVGLKSKTHNAIVIVMNESREMSRCLFERVSIHK